MIKNIFQSYLMGGFECSTHRNWQKRRIDVIAATRHDEFAEIDYARMMQIGLKTARDGIRWHLIEREPYHYDFSSAINQIRAAKKTGMQVIWDLFHYGYPDDLDFFSAEFPHRFAKFALAFAELLMNENNLSPIFSPVNEISFFSWIAGQIGMFAPFGHGRGDDVKFQLVRATIAGIDAIRTVYPAARFVQTDPAIWVTSASKRPSDVTGAKLHRESQFHALEMLIGKRESALGGDPKYLDIIGVNYYFNNQWRFASSRRVERGSKFYRPFNLILEDYFQRFGRPILIAETGIENEARPDWFRYVCGEAKIALEKGVPVEGICLYPIMNHPGWDDNRHCHNGLWDYPDENGNREIYSPLAEEIKHQQLEQMLI